MSTDRQLRYWHKEQPCPAHARLDRMTKRTAHELGVQQRSLFGL
jgi:hypothetical protein